MPKQWSPANMTKTENVDPPAPVKFTLRRLHKYTFCLLTLILIYTLYYSKKVGLLIILVVYTNHVAIHRLSNVSRHTQRSSSAVRC